MSGLLNSIPEKCHVNFLTIFVDIYKESFLFITFCSINWRVVEKSICSPHSRSACDPAHYYAAQGRVYPSFTYRWEIFVILAQAVIATEPRATPLYCHLHCTRSSARLGAGNQELEYGPFLIAQIAGIGFWVQFSLPPPLPPLLLPQTSRESWPQRPGKSLRVL